MDNHEYYYQDIQYYQKPKFVRYQEHSQQEPVYNNLHDTYRPIETALDTTLGYQKLRQYAHNR